MRHIIMCLALVFCLFVKVVGKNKIVIGGGKDYEGQYRQ